MNEQPFRKEYNQREYSKEWHKKNKEHVNTIARTYYHNHKEQAKLCMERYREKHKEQEQKRRREWSRKRKLLIIEHYSNGKNICNCCGEKHIVFLTIDHINNDGAEHRKKLGSAAHVYNWLIRNNFPEGYQVLCYNCNCGRYKNGGVCPHKQELSVNEYIPLPINS